jgi:hypothetical protein
LDWQDQRLKLASSLDANDMPFSELSCCETSILAVAVEDSAVLFRKFVKHLLLGSFRAY